MFWDLRVYAFNFGFRNWGSVGELGFFAFSFCSGIGDFCIFISVGELKSFVFRFSIRELKNFVFLNLEMISLIYISLSKNWI
jgi:hypothetical protein